MGRNSNQQFAWSAENFDSASCGMSADAYFAESFTAIITLMAFVFIIAVCGHLSINMIISVILGGIILIVRRKYKPVSRTR